MGDFGHPRRAPAIVPIKNAKNVHTDNNPKVQTTESPINELTDFGKYAIDGPKSNLTKSAM